MLLLLYFKQQTRDDTILQIQLVNNPFMRVVVDDDNDDDDDDDPVA
jgi:hypothetical protein